MITNQEAPGPIAAIHFILFLGGMGPLNLLKGTG